MKVLRQIRRRKILLAAPALLAISVAATACGGGGSSTAPSNSSTGSTERTVDQAFVAEMIPHHELAVEMAEVAQDQGEHPEVTELADDIVESQDAEIEEMKPIAEELGADEGEEMEGQAMEGMEGMSESGSMEEGSSSMSQDARVLGLAMDEMGMSMSAISLNGYRPFDRAFIDMMTPHHEGAIAMAEAELAKGEDSRLKHLAKRIIAAQQREVREMNEWREQWYGGPVPPGAMAEG
ncbi:MAG: DUF305 domain-containing protein [Actinobacteria bacterium]|nr:DUF305 domain-containing protein [Actinomycetota bacterium]